MMDFIWSDKKAVTDKILSMKQNKRKKKKRNRSEEMWCCTIRVQQDSVFVILMGKKEVGLRKKSLIIV